MKRPAFMKLTRCRALEVEARHFIERALSGGRFGEIRHSCSAPLRRTSAHLSEFR